MLGQAEFVTKCPCPADHRALVLHRCAQTEGCWLWSGTVNTDGYGIVQHGGRSWIAHRLAYSAFIGAVPAGLVVDHLCRVRSCVNPSHLEPVTNVENLRRGTRATPPPPPPIVHGTASAYSNRGCRCDECRAANTVRCVAYQRRRREAVAR